MSDFPPVGADQAGRVPVRLLTGARAVRGGPDYRHQLSDGKRDLLAGSQVSTTTQRRLQHGLQA